jgi:FdhE protein
LNPGDRSGGQFAAVSAPAAANLFTLRALRLEQLAEGHPLAEYLRLIAGLCRAQQQVVDDPPRRGRLTSSVIEACQQHGLPPFAADSLVREDAGWLG